MKIASKLSLVTLLLASLTACSYFQFPGVHKIYVQQGHIITEEMLDQLDEGMTKRQVRFVLGTPLLEDGFNADRWDYYYSLKRGDETLRERQLTVHFEDDELARYEGSAVREHEEAEEEETPLVPTNTEDDPLPTPGETPENAPDNSPLPTNTM